MKINSRLTAGVSILAVAAFAACTASASADQTFYPIHRGAAPMDPNKPPKHIGPYSAPYVAPKGVKSGTWADVPSLPFSKGPWGPMQLTDGTIIIEDYCTSPAQWYKLTPDSKGQYSDGTWSKIATMPSGYSPLFFSQQVLPASGNVIIEGGEYNDCSSDWTNKGAMYDPVSNTWTSVSPPSGWGSIGDAESIILPDGTYLLADCCFFGSGEQALATISGTSVTWSTSETWKCASSSDPCMDEEGLTPLPNGDVMLVDVWDHTSTSDETWIYTPSTNSWALGPNTANYLSTTSAYELGSAPLTPEGPAGGTVIQFSADTSLGVNDIYSVKKGTWTSGPVLKVGSTIYDQADAPSATLPDGNILADASPGVFSTPSHFWELTISKKGKVTATQVSDTKEAGSTSSFEGNELVTPTGQVLWDNSQVRPNEVALYTPVGKPKSSWLPVVSTVDTTLTVGSTGNAISGTNFNGWDLGGAYGDDAQAATNFPLVRITNNSTGDVCFARSYNFSTMGVWTQGTTNATFDIPSTCTTGASTLQVIVNGIASKGTAVTLNS